MTPIKKKSLKQINGSCDLEIKSIEGGFYIVDIIERSANKSYFLVNTDGSRVLRKNSADILVELKALTINNVSLMQDSAYDEMIGSCSAQKDAGIPIVRSNKSH